jgi:hypothetical protein
MTYTTDVSTYIGLVRMRIFDRNVANPVFQDEDIEAVYNSLERQNIKRTAAFFLETIATKEALILKVMKNLQLSTDGAKLADSLLKAAGELRSQADIEDAFTDGNTAFDWAEQVFDVFSERERIVKEILRDYA